MGLKRRMDEKIVIQSLFHRTHGVRFMKLTWDTDGISYYTMIGVKFKRGATFFICDWAHPFHYHLNSSSKGQLVKESQV